MIYKILEEINLNNGSNYKIEILQKYKENELFKRLLKMTYDSVSHIYGITMKNIPATLKTGDKYNLTNLLDILENEFCTRKVTGNKALKRLQEILENSSKENQEILKKVIERDLKIGIGKRSINKVFKKLIIKPLYMRCGVFTKDKILEDGKVKKGTYRNISYPAIIQLKADGTYREVTVSNGEVSFNSRSGEIYNYPLLSKHFSKLEDGKYIGELTISGTKDRAESNGLINSLNVPEEKIIIELWDYITLEEYNSVLEKNKGQTIYKKRLSKLKDIVKENSHIKVIEGYKVNNLKEALKKVSYWMNKGLEGGILKDYNGILEDGTSKYQLKLKLKIDADVRITGFTEGTKGTSREKTFGAITFETDDGKIKGQTSGFSDKELLDYNNRREELIGQIMVVEFNDITKSKKNDYYALSHPRHTCIRTDKKETDTLERVLELKEMAMNLE